MIGNNCHRTALNNTGDTLGCCTFSVVENVPIVLKTMSKLDVICTGPEFSLQHLCYSFYDSVCYKHVGYKYAALKADGVINL